MPYEIYRADGSFVTMVPDQTINSDALPINLFGDGVTNYGTQLNENFVWMLGNFASPRAPFNPTFGQLWYNTSSAKLSLYATTQQWIPLAMLSGDQTFDGSITVLDGAGDGATLGDNGILTLVRTVPNDGPEIDFLTYFGEPTANGGRIKLVNGILEITPGLKVVGNEEITGDLTVDGNGLIKGNLTVLGDGAFSSSLTSGGAQVWTTATLPPNTFVPLAGGTMTGSLIMENIPLIIDGPAGTFQREVSYTTSGTKRWSLLVDGSPETGNNAGSNLVFNRHADDGALIDQPLVIDRATGQVLIDGAPPWTSANFVPGNYLPISGGTLTGGLFVSNDDNGVTIIDQGNAYGVILRNDGSNFYLLATGPGSPYGTWSNARPFAFNLASGDVTLGNAGQPSNTTVNGNLTVAGSGAAGQLIVNGPITCYSNITASGDVTAFSDSRLKSNISTIEDGLTLVRSMRGVRYTNERTAKHGIGVVAQEMQAVLPEVVLTDSNGWLSVAYGNLTGVLIEAVKTLAATTDDLRDALSAATQRIDELASENAGLEHRINDLAERLADAFGQISDLRSNC